MLARLVAILVVLSACPVLAQEADTLRVDLEALRVTAARIGLTAAEAPLAVALDTRTTADRATDAGISLESVLRHIPGLWIADRENVALGERIAVRGMGARAPFGVRGVQVVLDGIPLTMADGQSAVLIADPFFIRRAELIRGPSSTIWGNASGGVLFLSTIPEQLQLAEARLSGGSFGLARVDVEVAHPLSGGRIGLAVSHARRDGFREHSGYAVTRGRAFTRTELGGGAALTALGSFEWAPHQEHPGALTQDEFATDPRQAQTNFVAQGAGKDSRQGQGAALLTAATPLGEVNASVFGVLRRMQNPLPFAIIDLDRAAGGSRLALERSDGPLRWTIGFDAALQRDDRQNWANDGGVRADLRLDQLETVTSAGAFARLLFHYDDLTLAAGLRYDRTRFRADDRFLADGDQSGTRTMAALSPSLGASLRAGSVVVYASASTGFDTPTTTELVNSPDGQAGFNPEVGPQRTRGVDIGVRGTDAAGRLFFDLAAFAIGVRDQLTPFVGDDDRTYFLNAEASTHLGIEVAAEWLAWPGIMAGISYAGNRFVFTEPSGEIAGNRIPGIPDHRLVGRLEYEGDGAFAALSLVVAGPAYADNENAARIDGFQTVHLRGGYRGLHISGVSLLPFVEIRNVFDTRYAGSIAINAAGGRYYEPAAGRSFHVGFLSRL